MLLTATTALLNHFIFTCDLLPTSLMRWPLFTAC